MTSKCTAATSRRTQQARNCAFAIAAIAVFLSTPVIAETSYYGGVNFAFLKHKFSGGSASGDGVTVSIDDTTLNYTALIGRIGAQFHENLSAEARLGFGISDDTHDFTATVNGSTATYTYDSKIDNLYGGYLRVGASVEKFYPYLLVGWTELDQKITVLGSTSNDSGSDFSYGIGTDIHVSDNISANLEWVNYYDKGNHEISGFLIGIVSSF